MLEVRDSIDAMRAASGGVDLWWVNDVSEYFHLSDDLAPSEKKRASAFVFEVDRTRFVARHKLLRRLLTLANDLANSDWALSTNAFGKPFLSGSPFVFNTSSSGDSMLIGMGYHSAIGEIGVDLEAIRHMPDAQRIARQFFAIDEARQLEQLAGHELNEAFFNCWTRKEAVVKAMGLGLSFELQRFSVSVLPGEPATIKQLDGAPCAWHLTGWCPSKGHTAAFATQHTPDSIRFHNLQQPMTL